jgi:hypothetical protein
MMGWASQTPTALKKAITTITLTALKTSASILETSFSQAKDCNPQELHKKHPSSVRNKNTQSCVSWFHILLFKELFLLYSLNPILSSSLDYSKIKLNK